MPVDCARGCGPWGAVGPTLPACIFVSSPHVSRRFPKGVWEGRRALLSFLLFVLNTHSDSDHRP